MEWTGLRFETMDHGAQDVAFFAAFAASCQNTLAIAACFFSPFPDQCCCSRVRAGAWPFPNAALG
jgi:hypothetical protein